MMLEKLHRLALKLAPVRIVAAGLAVFFLVAALLTLFSDYSGVNSMFRASLVGTLWAMMLYAFIELFQRVPAPASDTEGWWRRQWQKLKRGLYRLLSLAVIITTLLLLWMSLRLMTVG